MVRTIGPDATSQGNHPTSNKLEIKLFGGCVGVPSVTLLYAFKCTAPEFHEASQRLRSEMTRHIQALSENHRQLPVAIKNAWVGAMIAVVNGLTLRKRLPNKFDGDYELLVRDGLCAAVNEVVHTVQADDEFDVFLNRKSDVVICIRGDRSPSQKIVKLGNINQLVSRVANFSSGDDPPSTH